MVGVDFDLDRAGRAWFLEANVTPALGHQTAWERAQKRRLFADLAALLRARATGRSAPEPWQPVLGND